MLQLLSPRPLQLEKAQVQQQRPNAAKKKKEKKKEVKVIQQISGRAEMWTEWGSKALPSHQTPSQDTGPQSLGHSVVISSAIKKLQLTL